eukprot:jgi/Chrpa1/10937/Chrysochromulina_OHIO_Genome00019809-RA
MDGRMDSFRRRNKMIAGTKLAVEDAERREESTPSEELSKSRPATARRSARSPFSARRAAAAPAPATTNLGPEASPQNATRLAELKAELTQAIEAQDYAKVAELAPQMDQLKATIKVAMEAAVVATDNGASAPPAAANDDCSSDLGGGMGSGSIGSGMPNQMGGGMGGVTGGNSAVAAEVPNHMPTDTSLEGDRRNPDWHRTERTTSLVGEPPTDASLEGEPPTEASLVGEPPTQASLEAEPPAAFVPGLAAAPATMPRTPPMAPSPATGGPSGRIDGGRPSEAGSVTGSRESSPSLKAQGKLPERNDAFVKKAPTVAEPPAAEAVSLAQTDPAWIEAKSREREVALKALSAWSVPTFELKTPNAADSARYAPLESVRALAEKKVVSAAIPTIEVYIEARRPHIKQGLQKWLFRARERLHCNTGRMRASLAEREGLASSRTRARSSTHDRSRAAALGMHQSPTSDRLIGTSSEWDA